MKAILLKKMTVNGVDHSAGEIVDVSDWRNCNSLINMRYISVVKEDVKPIESEEIAKEKSVKAKSSVKK